MCGRIRARVLTSSLNMTSQLLTVNVQRTGQPGTSRAAITGDRPTLVRLQDRLDHPLIDFCQLDGVVDLYETGHVEPVLLHSDKSSIPTVIPPADLGLKTTAWCEHSRAGQLVQTSATSTCSRTIGR